MGNLLSLLIWPLAGGLGVVGLALLLGVDRTVAIWAVAVGLTVLLLGALPVWRRLLRPLAGACPEGVAGVGGLAAELRRLTERAQGLEEELRATQEREREARSVLRQSEERFQVAVRGANDGLWEWELDGNSLTLSPRWKAMLGYTAEEFPDARDFWRNQIHPDDLAAVDAALAGQVAGDASHFEFEARFRHRDGHYRWFYSRGAALRRASGKPQRVVGIDTDVTRLKRVQDIVQHIAAGTSGTHGEQFFQSLARHFAGAMDVACALVTECIDQPATRVRTLALWRAQEFQNTLEYDLGGTPCEKVIHGASTCFVPARVAEVYPKEAGFESYIGVPIFGSDQRVIGHLALLDTRRMGEEMLVEPIFRIFCARAGAEIERLQAVARLQQLGG